MEQTWKVVENNKKSDSSRDSARALLASNILQLRRAKGLSQESLAFDAGLHRTFIAHVERQARNISVDNIERIAHALSVEPFQLLLPIQRMR